MSTDLTAAPSELATDEALASDVREGSLAPFAVLYDRHRDAATRLAAAMAPPEDVEDLVAEGFEQTLSDLRAGISARGAFRPQLLTAVAGTVPSTAAAEAFEALPPRTQTILWHTTVDGERPAAIAPLVGADAREVARETSRARTAWFDTFVDGQADGAESRECATAIRTLQPYLRGELRPGAAQSVSQHLHECMSCTMLSAELAEAENDLGGLLALAFVGEAAAAYRVAPTTGLADRAARAVSLPRLRLPAVTLPAIAIPRPRLPRFRIPAFRAIVGVGIAATVAVFGASAMESRPEPSGPEAPAATDARPTTPTPSTAASSGTDDAIKQKPVGATDEDPQASTAEDVSIVDTDQPDGPAPLPDPDPTDRPESTPTPTDSAPTTAEDPTLGDAIEDVVDSLGDALR